jgi:NitT/TauT family transport system ATP-binding protein
LTALVALAEVSPYYGGAGGALAVDGLSFAIEHGEFAAVVGPSGRGKSTLMKLGHRQVSVQGAIRRRRSRARQSRSPAAVQRRPCCRGYHARGNRRRRWKSSVPIANWLRRKAEYVARAEALLASVGSGAAAPFRQLPADQRASLCAR